MATLKAGVGRSIVTPRVGAALIGYFKRPLSNVVHDDLNARTLVLDDGATVIVLCNVELLWLPDDIVRAIREAAAARCALRPENIFIFTTHTHSGPSPYNAQDWDRPLADIIADSIVQAYESRAEAKLAAGFGFLQTYSINRRYLNRPIDPSVGVIRVDRADGTPLAVFGNYACHAVVMGYDSAAISGDWPGYASRQLEADLGHGAVAMFSQGGAGDINPLTEVVRLKLQAGYPVTSIGDLTTYYGEHTASGVPDHGVGSQPDAYNIGDRGGGTFLECDILARAYAAEVKRVYRGLKPKADVPLWVERVILDGSPGADEAPASGLTQADRGLLRDVDPTRMEIMMVGIGSVLLLSQPGEVFSETAYEFRKATQQMGYGYPMLVSYANGSFAYLPPANAFLEGGYEVGWALRMGLSRHLQDRIVAATMPVFEKHRS